MLEGECELILRFRTKNISTPPEWDASPYKQLAAIHSYSWGGERHYGSKVSYPRTQHTVPGQGSNPDHANQSPVH